MPDDLSWLTQEVNETITTRTSRALKGSMIGEITTRDALKPGDCFEYIDYPDQPDLAGRKTVVTFIRCRPHNLPEGWGWSSDRMLKERGAWRVRRIKPWWSGKGDELTVQPTALPCVEPMDDFHALCALQAEGMTGLDCLVRYEEAMRFEDLRRTGPDTFETSRLTSAQVALARRVWQAKLRGRVTIAKARAAECERARVTCDPVDEMPNLADA